MVENYFKLLGFETHFDLNTNLLTQSFRTLQKKFHPDNYVHCSDMEKRLSVQQSSLINDAYQTLKNPLKRAIYQLSLHGITLKDNETSMDPDFLMQQMEFREQLGNISQNCGSLEDLEIIQLQVINAIGSNTQKISQLFNSTDKKSLDQIKNTILRMQFLTKLQQQCDDLEEDLQNQSY